MNASDLQLKIKTQLGDFLKAHQFQLSESVFDSNRGACTLRWGNDISLIEIYYDPADGEINCRVADAINRDVEKVNWLYLYELSPLTHSELDLAHASFRTLDEQLSTICKRLPNVFGEKGLLLKGSASF